MGGLLGGFIPGGRRRHARPVGIKCGKLVSRRRNRCNALKGIQRKLELCALNTVVTFRNKGWYSGGKFRIESDFILIQLLPLMELDKIQD